MKRAIMFALSWLAAVAVAQAVGNTATITWGPPTGNTDGTALAGTITYNIYQGAKGAEVKTASGVSGTSFTVSTGLADGTTVCWYVTAVEGGQESAPSAEACKTFPPAVPLPPSSVTVK